MPLKGAALEERGWKTKGEIMTFMECRECEYKDTRTEDKDLSLESS